MLPEDQRRRLSLILIGLVFLFAPLLILVATLEALIIFGDIDSADLTLVELIELYLLDLLLLGLIAVIVYRLTRYLVERELPQLSDAFEPEDEEENAK